jgi:iodotyrosine deiodinase
MTLPRFVPHTQRHVPEVSAEEAARRFHAVLSQRRSIREFSTRPVSRETVEWLVRCAASAPSGANRQPWRFVCVQDKAIQHRIRVGAEAEEREFYARRATPEWLEALAPLGTDANKEFLEVAPWLIVVFRLTRGDSDETLYYTHESVGIACGMLLAAAQDAGLATLTHTPSPMAFLAEILGRPSHEKPYLLIPVGYASDDCQVPEAALLKKPFTEIAVFL